MIFNKLSEQHKDNLNSVFSRKKLHKTSAVLIALTALAATHAKAQEKYIDITQNDNTYFALTGGSGITNVKGVEKEEKKQDFRSFDIRFGQHLTDNLRLDFVHANEGHPHNHHRDGFSSQLVYSHMLTKNTRLELGTGPYVSFDTTRNSQGIELNEKRVGLVSTAALVYPINYIGTGVHLRAQWNNYVIPNRPVGNSFLIGFGVDIENSMRQSKARGNGLVNEVWLSLANTKINHGGPDTTVGFSVEAAHRFTNNYALSVGLLDEGGDNGWTNRRGITAQIWRYVPLGKYLEGRIGAGPYFAQDKYEHPGAFNTKGVITFGLNYEPHWLDNENIFFGVSLTRVIDKKGYENDADIARLTVGYRF
ncbi:hypothetical protein [Paraferrimonas sedimenticola]|uniref:Uncharacterized protein n=1 Tax=Paraferrimonas sedimenticola TaxID=375674 RepID=A0AA37VWL2_9GAMM|nr:hypothetical protein [Paraferrimonas sedimenticola]GLP96386.1 hypothetical protein GCM10007895_16920 [Paraferrimonas sedimenticola]